MSRPERPRFYGVRTYQDPQGRFSFRFPMGWNEFDLDEDRDGILVSPEEADPATFVAMWISELDTHVVAEDLEDLRSGTDDGIASLPDCEVVTSTDDLLGNLVKFERIYTFTENGIQRKRRTWIMYVDTWQMVFTWQGSSVEEYHYWLPMGNYAFATFNIPDTLWFATDRDLAPYREAEATSTASDASES